MQHYALACLCFDLSYSLQTDESGAANATEPAVCCVHSDCPRSEETIPACPDCGTMFKKTHEYLNPLRFETNCTDKHDLELLGQVEGQTVKQQAAS
jgi:hypothetical protein